MKEIPLTQGMFALVDNDVFDNFAWIGWRSDGRYVVRKISERMKTFFPRYSRMFLHNLIMKPQNGFIVDHINGDGFDCRRGNLRIIKPSQNAMNRGINSNNISGYKGVSIFRKNGKFKKWRAIICVDGKWIHLGLFDDKKEAASVYDEAARKYHGEFARLNNV